LIIAWPGGEGYLNLMFLGDGRVQDENEREEKRLGKSL
jgi:hypothetical protein